MVVEPLQAVAVLGLVAIAAWQDLRRRTIPNWIPVALVLLWAAHAVIAARPGPAASAVGLAALVLTVGYLAWLGGFLGGGDVKLLAATALWAGASGLPTLLLATAIVGGALALAIGLKHRIAKRHRSGPDRLAAPRRPGSSLAQEGAGCAPALTSVPYAVAILAGVVWCWLAVHPL